MADNVIANAGVGGATFATDDVGGIHYPISKLAHGALDSVTLVSTASGLPVQAQGAFPVTDNGGLLSIDDGAGSITVDGTVAITGVVSVNDNAGSLTVDAPVGTPVFVRLSDGAAAITALPITDNAGSITVDGTVSITANSSVNVAQLAGTTTDTNSGNKSAGTLRVVIATDQPQLTNALKVDGSGVTQPISGSVSSIPATSGGLIAHSAIATAAANQDSTSVKASAGQLYRLYVSSINAAVRYLKLYDKASGPTSADTPVMRIPIPGNTAGAGITLDFADLGLAFANGIAYRLTTGVADADTGAVTTQEHVVNLAYK